MIQRELLHKAAFYLKKYPVLFITGPRQSGKTTFSQQLLAKKYTYLNLELPDVRLFAQKDPHRFLEEYKNGVIIDEAQHVPELFSYIQHYTDQRKQNGEYILSGSQNFLMFERITQSLAGRAKIFNLLPLSLKELNATKIKFQNWEEYAYNGFYPRLYDQKIPTEGFYPDYIQTYVERDVRQIINVSDLNLFHRFLVSCAARVGQLINFSQIGNEIGADHKTIQRWLSILETSFIVYQLPPYFNNINKRLIKTPKLYFYDTGLLCYLLGIQSADELSKHHARGNIFENFVINEISKNSYNKGIKPQLYYWRDKTGNEVDLIQLDGTLINSIEIKAAMTIHQDFFKGLTFLQKQLSNEKLRSYVIYGGNESQKRTEAVILSWKEMNHIK